MSLHIRRNPEFACILSAGAVHSTVDNCKLPETLSHVSPLFVACYLIKLCSAVDKGNACICVAVGKGILACRKISEKSGVPVSPGKGHILFILGYLVK